MKPETPITYSSVGVNYDAMDPLKRLAQAAAKTTGLNLSRFPGAEEVEASRGESAYVLNLGNYLLAFTLEGLGTKSLVADEMRNITNKTYYDQLAQCTVAMIVNDLITVGADPAIINAYFGASNSEWFEDEERMKDLTTGWANACNLAGVAWGGGESPALTGIIEGNASELLGAGVGMIFPSNRLTLGDRLTAGDAILLIESSGIHANGLTLARRVSRLLPEGYATLLPSGRMYGEALLTPTIIYASLIRDLYNAEVDIHYMSNITGHGWRKLMRADRDLTYVIEELVPVQEEFKLIQEKANLPDEEMYKTFNMGAGYAVFLPESQVGLAKEIADQKHDLKAYQVGYVINPHNIFIKPLGVHFDQLGVR